MTLDMTPVTDWNGNWGEPANEDTPTREPRLEFLSGFSALDAWDRRGEHVAVETPIESLNEGTAGGLPVGQVTNIVAYTGGRKSELARQIANHASESGHPVLYIDVELGYERIIERTLAQFSGIAAAKLLDGQNLTKSQVDRLISARQRVQDNDALQYLCPGSGVDLVELEVAIGAAMPVADKPPLIVLDSLQRLAASAKGETQRLQTQHFMWWAERLAQRLQAAVVLTCEQKRSQEGKRPGPEDVITSGAESRAVEFVPALFLALIPETDDSDEVVTDASKGFERRVSVLIAKNRMGATGYLPEDLVFTGPCWEMAVLPRDVSSIGEAILAVLPENEWMTAEQIRKKIKKKQTLVTKALAGLTEEGLIIRGRMGVRLK